ncbi:transposase family protein [Streptomyces sp. TRM68367]|nr:transposase family protein [Streptomyces sp. TRM68367]
MPPCPTLPTSRQLAEQHDLAAEELCTPDRLPSLLDAVRTVPDPRAAHPITHPWPMLLGLVACALLCGMRSVRGVIRWASGQGAGTFAALEVPAGAPDIARTAGQGSLVAEIVRSPGRVPEVAQRPRGHDSRGKALVVRIFVLGWSPRNGGVVKVIWRRSLQPFTMAAERGVAISLSGSA